MRNAGRHAAASASAAAVVLTPPPFPSRAGLLHRRVAARTARAWAGERERGGPQAGSQRRPSAASLHAGVVCSGYRTASRESVECPASQPVSQSASRAAREHASRQLVSQP